MPQTGREIITDTIKFLPDKIPFPTESLSDKLHRAVTKIVNLLNTQQSPPALPMLHNTKDISKAFTQIQKILQHQLLPKSLH